MNTRKTPPKILIARLSAVGDVVRTVPAVKAIRQHFPKSEIHWLVEDRCAAIIEGLSYVNKLQIIPRKKWRDLTPVQKIIDIYRVINSLRQEKYDIYLDFHGILKSGLYGFLSGIPRRIGYPAALAKEGNIFFTNEKIKAASSHISRYTRNFLLARHFDPAGIEERADLPLTKADREFAQDFLLHHGLQGKKYVSIFPGSSQVGKYKRWPPELYGNLVDLLHGKLNLASVICWGPGEEDLVNKVKQNCLHPPVIMPLASLKQLCAVIERSCLFIGGDTGPMHMASMVGTPVTAIFGPSDLIINEPARFTPFRYVHAGVDCAPCRNKSCPDLKCLRNITPEMVFEAVEKILAQDIQE